MGWEELGVVMAGREGGRDGADLGACSFFFLFLANDEMFVGLRIFAFSASTVLKDKPPRTYKNLRIFYQSPRTDLHRFFIFGLQSVLLPFVPRELEAKFLACGWDPGDGLELTLELCDAP